MKKTKKITKMTMTTRTRIINSQDSEFQRDYYCSMKFRFLKVDLSAKTTYNCHAASPHPVDFDWLQEHPGQLFNTTINVSERKQMLLNQRNSSCEQNCWSAEDCGAQSPRELQGGKTKTHLNSVTSPEIIDITVGSNCNLTCSYCCKEFSSSWRRDILENGNYQLTNFNNDNRYIADNKDKVLAGISQPSLKATNHYQTLMQEIKLAAPNLKELIITGGEPLLDNALIDTIQELDLAPDAVVELYTGLGVNINRFLKILTKLENIPGLTIRVSAECVGKWLEFNRYGIQWDDFEKKIQLIKDRGIKLEFQSTVTNLTIFGFAEFYRRFCNEQIILTFAYQPTMMSPYVLDDTSKNQLRKEFKTLPEKYKNMLLKSIQSNPSEQQRVNMAEFLSEFVSRRADLSLEIFPKEFLQWLEIEHVV